MLLNIQPQHDCVRDGTRGRRDAEGLRNRLRSHLRAAIRAAAGHTANSENEGTYCHKHQRRNEATASAKTCACEQNARQNYRGHGTERCRRCRRRDDDRCRSCRRIY